MLGPVVLRTGVPAAAKVPVRSDAARSTAYALHDPGWPRRMESKNAQRT